jgi:hypothetical protein
MLRQGLKLLRSRLPLSLIFALVKTMALSVPLSISVDKNAAYPDAFAASICPKLIFATELYLLPHSGEYSQQQKIP